MALKAKKPKDVKPGRCKGLIFGKPGAGKTWFALNFPAPYFIDTEGGANLSHYMQKLQASGGAYLGQEDGANDFDVILDQVKSLATEKHSYKTLVIDSVTKVFQSTIAGEQERLGDKDVFGQSKKPAISKMRRLLMYLDRLDMNVWLIAHETAEWGMQDGERKELGKTADVWDKVIHELHLAMRFERAAKGFRRATITKSRLEGFPELDSFVVQEGDKDLGYVEFSKRFGRDYIEAPPTPICLCTPEQAGTIAHLVSVLNVSEEEIKKILERGNAETYHDLSEENAGKMISWLQKKIEKGEK